MLAFAVGCSEDTADQPDRTQTPAKQLAESKPGKKADEVPETPPPTLKFNGVYRSTKANDGWQYLRFYSDGTVISVSSTGDSDAVARWFKKENTESKGLPHGRYEIKDQRLSFSAATKRGTVDYEGVIEENALTLKSHSRINDHRATRTFSFVQLPE